MNAIPRPPTKMEITIPRALVNWATESEENKEILADVIFDYINYRYMTGSKITFIEYLRSDNK
jgi:hypothetical protein